MEQMPVYGPQFKEQIVKKVMPPHSQSVAQISRDTAVAVPTLYSWKKLFRNQGYVVPAKSSRPDNWDSKAKLAAIIETAAMNEAQRSEYRRQHGLYPEQLDAWKATFEALDADAEPASKADLAQQRKKLKQLEKEILRKQGTGRSSRLAGAVKKSPGHLGHERGRLISLEMKQMAIELIAQAVACRARRHKACEVLGISCRTLRRWSEQGHELADQRGSAARQRSHPQALTPQEK